MDHVTPRICLVLLAASVVAVPGASGEVPPLERELPVAPVQLELHDCRIDIEVVESGETPFLRIQAEPDAAGAMPDFEVRAGAGAVRIARTADPDGDGAATATVELVLAPSQPVQLLGEGLSVTLRGPVAAERTAGQQPPPSGREGAGPQAAAATYSFDLTESELFLSGTVPSSVVGRDSVAIIENSAGSFAAHLDRGSLEMRNHVGGLSLNARDANCTVEGLEGSLGFDLIGGSLVLRDGKGGVQGHSAEGLVSFDRWSGGADLSGERASFEFRDGAMAQVGIKGAGLLVRIDGLQGSVTARADGGSVTSDAMEGTLEAVTSAAAEVDITDHRGPVKLTLEGDSAADVSEVNGMVTATVNGSDLTLSGAEALELTARNARMSLSGVRMIRNLDIRASEYDLDLSDVHSRSLDLRVDDRTFATVSLPAPCRVQLRDSAAASQQVDVTGCEFQMQATGRWRGGSRRGVDGRPTFLLTAKVSESGSLRVRGGP